MSAIPLTAGAQTLAVYDDFRSTAIDGRRWSGSEQTIAPANLVMTRGGWSNQVEGPWTRHPTFSVVNTAVNVRIVDGQLELRLTTAGGQQADPDVAPGHGRLSFRLSAAAWQAPQPVSRLQAQVTITETEAQPCRSTGGSRARAQLVAHLFNDGASPLVGDFTGNVFATLSLQRTSFDADRIVGVVSRCRDSRCTLADDVGSVVFNRTWLVGRPHLLTITHQPGGNRVLFSVSGGGITAENRYVGYPAPAARLEGDRDYELRVENTPANCPARDGLPAQRVEATMQARFDTVRINASAMATP